MEWYRCKDVQGRAILVQMEAEEAARVNAELATDFCPLDRVSGALAQLLADRAERDRALVVEFPPEAEPEALCDRMEEVLTEGR